MVQKAQIDRDMADDLKIEVTQEQQQLDNINTSPKQKGSDEQTTITQKNKTSAHSKKQDTSDGRVGTQVSQE